MNKKILIVLMSMLFLTVSCKKVENVFDGESNNIPVEKEFYSNRYLSTYYPNTYMNATQVKDEYRYLTYDFLELIKFSDFDNKAIHGGYQSIMAVDNKSGTYEYGNLELVDRFTPEEVLKMRFDGIKELCEEEGSTWSDFKIHDSIKAIEVKECKAAVGTFDFVEYIPYMDVTINRRIKRYVIFKEGILVSVTMAPSMLSTYDEEIKEMEEILKDTNFNFSGK